VEKRSLFNRSLIRFLRLSLFNFELQVIVLDSELVVVEDHEVHHARERGNVHVSLLPPPRGLLVERLCTPTLVFLVSIEGVPGKQCEQPIEQDDCVEDRDRLAQSSKVEELDLQEELNQGVHHGTEDLGVERQNHDQQQHDSKRKYHVGPQVPQHQINRDASQRRCS